MNTRLSVVLSGAILLAVSGTLVLFKRNDRNCAASSVPSKITTGARGSQILPNPETEQTPRASGKTLTPPDLALFDGYLSRCERDDNSLVAVYFLTHDEALLEELRKQAQTPIAYLLLATRSEDPTEKLAWASLWTKSDPQNNAAKLLEASCLAGIGNVSEARLALSNIQMNGQFHTPESEVRLQMVEGLEAIGWNSTDARRMSSHDIFEFKMGAAFKGLAQTLWEHDQGTTDDERIRAATDQIRIGDAVETWGSNQDKSGFGWAIKIRALETLPPETLFGDTGATVQETIKKLTNQQDEEVKEAIRYRAIWEKVSDEQRAKYFDRLQILSAQESRAWLEREVNRSSK